MKKAITMDPRDNVATALTEVRAGDEVEVLSTTRAVVQHLRANDSLPLGHKIALADIAAGQNIIKYGAKIGSASVPIHTGDYVHIHNVESDRMPLTKNMLGHKQAG
ncbi:MAG: UxaA family hydrolase [Dehalococcoidia bacterium]|nr:UxaA family hydrolase [Dehalococcoidia bacterium]